MKKEEHGNREERLVKVLRSKAQQYLRLPGVTSVGVGYKVKDGKQTKELCIQFTVAKKLSIDQLQTENMSTLPESIEDEDGAKYPIDVIERSYEPSFRVIHDPAEEEAQPEVSPRKTRRSRLETIMPGISVSHKDGTAGTFGAVVYDNQTSQPYILSNWHVLQGPTGVVADTIVQPGPFDDGAIDENAVGKLVRSHLGVAGDCAVASIEERQFDEAIFELAITPTQVGRVNLGDKVVKSGRTTGITHGIVTRVGVVVNINYGGTVGSKQIGGFEVRPNPDKPARRGEISMGGDSGSLWLIDSESDDKDVAVGLHFAGETDPRPSAEHAIACNIDSVLAKLDVSLTDQHVTLVDDEELWNEVFARLDLIGQRISLLERRGPCQCMEPGVGPSETKQTVSTPATAMVGAEGIPVYGNWCGPGHGGGNPIDDVDRACMRHDKCYGRKGYFDCQCDAQLLRDLDQALASGNVRPLGRVMAPIIRAWFSAQPCMYHFRGIPIPGGTGGIAHLAGSSFVGVKKAGKGAKKVWKRIKAWLN